VFDRLVRENMARSPSSDSQTLTLFFTLNVKSIPNSKHKLIFLVVKMNDYDTVVCAKKLLCLYSAARPRGTVHFALPEQKQ